MIKKACDLTINDRILISDVVCLRPYTVAENEVVISKVETSKGRVRAYHGITSSTFYVNQTVVVI